MTFFRLSQGLALQAFLRGVRAAHSKATAQLGLDGEVASPFSNIRLRGA